MELKKDYVNRVRLELPKEGVLFVDFIEMMIKKRQRRMGNNYARNYRTVIYHINRFSEINDAIIYTNSVNEEFLDDFIVYMEDSGLRKTYIKNTLTLIKGMAKKAGNYGYAVDFSFDDVDIDDEETPAVYLSMNDIARIYYFKGLTKKQEKIKDLFVIGCLTSLRYSDLLALSKANFKNGYIDITTKKTKTRVVIPVHDFINEIYNKYNGDIPNGLTAQHFNRYIKLICKKIGFDDIVYTTYTKGGKLVTEKKEKWELISSHTARRSGATNLLNTGRMSVSEIMGITGHTTEKNFRRYIKNSKEDNARQMSGDVFFRK